MLIITMVVRSLFFSFLILFSLPVFVSAQSNSSDQRRQIASLAQDVEALRSVVGKLRIEVESLQRENESLRKQVREANASQSSQADVMRLVDARLASLRAEMLKADDENRKEIVQSVTKQMDSLASQVQIRLKSVAEATAVRPTPIRPPSFGEDYPKTGINYLVQPGDTLSMIASRNDSRTSWIRDANKIVNPSRDLLAGQTIFVPQSE